MCQVDMVDRDEDSCSVCWTDVMRLLFCSFTSEKQMLSEVTDEAFMLSCGHKRRTVNATQIDTSKQEAS